MEDHVDTAGTGSGSVAMVTDSPGSDPDLELRVLCDRVKVLEQNASATNQSDSYLRNRIRELETAERTLQQQLNQLASASHLHWPSMQHCQRLDQRLHMLRQEVRTMTQEKERGERLWRERLQRCQNQLKAKEEEMSRQSQYFHNFKTQLQHKLSLARDREQSLQNRVHTLEKQLLDMTVSAATNMATFTAVSITAGSATHWEEHERLFSLRGEGEGEEEGEKRKKEEMRRQWQRRLGHQRERGQDGTEGEKEEEQASKGSNETRLQGFILSLQEDLRVLLEREEKGVVEQRGLMEQLQEAQENSHFLHCKVEEMKADVSRLKLSESSLMEEVEELREENQRLQQSLREAANQTASRSTASPESASPSPAPGAVSPMPFSDSSTTGHRVCSSGGSGKVQLTLDERTGKPHSAAVTPVHHQATAESTKNDTEDHSSHAKSDMLPLPKPDLLNLSAHFGSKPDSSLQSRSLAAETVEVGGFNLGTWCSGGALNLEESPSEEADALREAYRSLGLGEDLDALQEQRGLLEAALQQTQEQLQQLAQENARLQLQLRKQAEEQEAEAGQGSARDKVNGMPTQSISHISDRGDHLLSSPAQDDIILTLTQEDLTQALNQENRALAERIRELLAHIELREGESLRELNQLREHISRQEADRARLEQEIQEQGCLITELTKKTEDDLNTIMELQQRLAESRQSMEESQGHTLMPNKEMYGLQSKNIAEISGIGSAQLKNLEGCVDSLVDSLLQSDEEPQTVSSQNEDHLTNASALGSQDNNSLCNSVQGSTCANSLTGQIDQLTKSIQSLKEEEKELTGSVGSLREEQREVALSVQTQTEEKQQLTRTVWGLKEERDRVTQSLASLKQEREQLTRMVCGLKDEREQFVRSLSGREEEKEQLSKSLSGLEEERKELLESLLKEKDERDQIVQSLKRLQEDRDRLKQVVCNLKQETDERTDSLKCLKERRDQEESLYTSKEERDKLMQSVRSLKEEKERIEHSISNLTQEEQQIVLSLQGLREERDNLQFEVAAEGRSQTQHLSCQSKTYATKKEEATVFGTGEGAAQKHLTATYKGTFTQQGLGGNQEQSDLIREIESLGAKLKKSQEELDKTHSETKRLHSELHQSEAKREETERKAAQAASEVKRMTDVANQMEETRKENDNLTTQVKELQSRLTGLAREKAGALSLKAQMEQQFRVLEAQLKSKTVALEELNSEYITLKRQGSKGELSSTLISLRSRYDDIRAKYDVLLKKKSQTDLDIAPLKAKLSCLVVKCQERNSLLVQMMRAMHRHGCLDFTLSQQVEQLLSDAALQDYTATFTLGAAAEILDYSSGITPGFMFKIQDYDSGFTPDQRYSSVFPPAVQGANPQHKNQFTHEAGAKHQEQKNGSITDLQDCRGEVIVTPTGTLKKNANSPVPTSAMQEHANVRAPPSAVAPAQMESASNLMPSSLTQPCLSVSGLVQATSRPEVKGESSTGTASLSEERGTFLGAATSSPDRCVSLCRRLSSPEKIISLHEQLQKTLLSSHTQTQAPVVRERGLQTRKSLSDSAAAELGLTSQTKIQSLTVNITSPIPVPVTTAKHAPQVPTKPVTTNPSTTLFTAVASRSANITFSPSMFTHTLSKAATDTTITSAISSSSCSLVTTLTTSKAKSTTNRSIYSFSTPTVPISSKPTSPTIPVASDTSTLTNTNVTPRTTASITDAVCSAAAVPTVLKILLLIQTPLPQTALPLAHQLPPRYIFLIRCLKLMVLHLYIKLLDLAWAALNLPLALLRDTTCLPEGPLLLLQSQAEARPKPEAPADVGSVEVIRTVGQSSLMIGWERPALDDLGCSNGTFVYGYRVYVDGDFHKSVMSSACTKCILENIDLSVPVHISVQTLGSNGLTSNRVHTMYRTLQLH
ncbi:LOW QUALITY PROTEIN: rootletin-like [Myripristis murdjan]|uniref:LOW QUALITY PROTEIN: rootletin-like n=1 Tax=Myripristis murdjan TaxID=586833 RepID=UPI0011763430|nr:LOW QUALITY PROTEIN: rootletin-like [Myripristis murdjan]